MPLFHATTSIEKLDQPKTAHVRTLTEIQARIDKEFDQHRPDATLSRSGALFAGDDPPFCAAYLVTERRTATDAIHIYRVEMSAPIKHPMCLADYTKHFLEDKATLTKIIREYWIPTASWKCWEYLASSMTPVAMEPTPDANAIAGARFRYGADLDLARRLWPIQNNRIMRQL